MKIKSKLMTAIATLVVIPLISGCKPSQKSLTSTANERNLDIDDTSTSYSFSSVDEKQTKVTDVKYQTTSNQIVIDNDHFKVAPNATGGEVTVTASKDGYASYNFNLEVASYSKLDLDKLANGKAYKKSNTIENKLVIPSYYYKNDTATKITELYSDDNVSAFEYCDKLTEVSIPNTVTKIDDFAFCYCTNLEKITIPSSVTKIDGSAFAGCSKLTFNLDNNDFFVTENNGKTLYNKDKTELISYPSANSGTTLPSGILKIGNYAFAGSLINSLDIPSSVTTIGQGAFAGTQSFTTGSVSIGENVVNIGAYAFYLSNVSSIVFKDGNASFTINNDNFDVYFSSNESQNATALTTTYPLYKWSKNLDYTKNLEITRIGSTKEAEAKIKSVDEKV